MDVQTLGAALSLVKKSSMNPEQIETAVDSWLDENITNPSNPPLDRSLTQDSAAAPADMVGSLKSALTDKAPVIISSASGSIASFPDGADGMPVKELTVSIEPVQSGSGDPSPTNVRPITGWTGANVWRTGVNVWDEEWEQGGIDLQSGQNTTSSSTMRSTNYISVVPSKTYYSKKSGLNLGFRKYGRNKEYLGFISANSVDIEVPFGADVYYVRFVTNSVNAYDPTTAPISINYPSSDHDYHPGHVNTIPITFPSAAGTVYGGSLTVNEDGTGRLLVDMKHVDLGELTYTKYGSCSFGTVGIADRLWDTNVHPKMLCSQYYENMVAFGTTGTIAGLESTCDGQILVAGGSSRIFIIDSTHTNADATAFKSAMSGVQLVYELATPITYDLTALEVMETLKGVNNVWADTGAVEVTYRADTKTYVDNASPDIPVTDVQVNGTSILNNGVANVPIAGDSRFGVVRVRNSNSWGVKIDDAGSLDLRSPNNEQIKGGSASYIAITPSVQHRAVYYALAKLAGADMKNASGETLGIFPEAQKSAISTMLNGSVAVSGSTPSITALPGVRYVCGECATLTIAVPASGIVDVVFESGSTATVLTVTPPTGMTIKWANGFDPSSLDANTTYEINICDGLGVAGSWT